MKKIFFLTSLIIFACKNEKDRSIAKHLQPINPKDIDIILSIQKKIKELDRDNSIIYRIDNEKCNLLTLNLMHKYEDLPDSLLKSFKNLNNLFEFGIISLSKKIPNLELSENLSFIVLYMNGLDTLNLNKDLRMFDKITNLKIFDGDTSKSLVYDVDSNNNVSSLRLSVTKINNLNNILELFPKLKHIELDDCSISNLNSFRCRKKMKISFSFMSQVNKELIRKSNPTVEVY